MVDQLPPGYAVDPDPPEGYTVDSDPPAGFSVDNAAAYPPASSAFGAFGRGVERSLLPSAAGVAGFGPGAAAGAWAGAFGGPLAPLTVPAGALIGGALGSGAAGWAANKAQASLLNYFPSAAQTLGLDDTTAAADQTAHPYASFAGDLAPQALFLRPGFAGKIPALIGGAIGGAGEAARELADASGFDPLKLGMATGAGALLQNPTALGRGLGVPSHLGVPDAANDPAATSESAVAPVAPASGIVVDPISGKTAPAVDPQTGAPFYQWGQDSTGARYPNYGTPDPSKAVPNAAPAVTPPSSRLVVDIDGGKSAAAGAVEPVAPVASSQPTPSVSTVIDGPALKAAASNSQGEVSMAAAGDHLRSVADSALANGADVTLHVDGKAVPITAPGLTDAQGQRWGAMPILTSEAGRNNRLEVSYPSDGVGANPRVDAAPDALPPGYTIDPEPAPSAQPNVGDLWQAHPDELREMLADKNTSDRDKLIKAFGPVDAAEFERLDRKRNSSLPHVSDAGSDEFDAKFGDLTPEQERAAYGLGETDAQADDIKEALNAHNDLALGTGEGGNDWLGYVAALGARRATVDDLAAVTHGKGSPQAQAAFVRLRGAYQALAEQGVSAKEIPGRMIDALVSRAGWTPDQASEIVGGFAGDMAKHSALGVSADAGPSRLLPPCRRVKARCRRSRWMRSMRRKRRGRPRLARLVRSIRT